VKGFVSATNGNELDMKTANNAFGKYMYSKLD
jgi:hypothetical protein